MTVEARWPVTVVQAIVQHTSNTHTDYPSLLSTHRPIHVQYASNTHATNGLTFVLPISQRAASRGRECERVRTATERAQQRPRAVARQHVRQRVAQEEPGKRERVECGDDRGGRRAGRRRRAGVHIKRRRGQKQPASRGERRRWKRRFRRLQQRVRYRDEQRRRQFRGHHTAVVRAEHPTKHAAKREEPEGKGRGVNAMAFFLNATNVRTRARRL